MKFTIRDLLLVTVIVALAAGWLVERTRLQREWLVEKSRLQDENDRQARQVESLRADVKERHNRWLTESKVHRANSAELKKQIDQLIKRLPDHSTLPTSQAPVPSSPKD